MALLEPKITKGNIMDYQRKSACQGSLLNVVGTIWLVWESDVISSVITNREQFITVELTYSGGPPIMLICVYASYDGRKRRELWNELTSTRYNLPCMVVGNFNLVLLTRLKIGGNSININDVKEFNEMISKASLLNGGFSGSKFTWNNSRLGKANILQRLDRVLLNTEWILSFKTSNVHQNKGCSHHSPLLTKSVVIDSKGTSFKFNNSWILHPKFPQLVKDVWITPTTGRPLVKFVAKLSLLGRKRKTWNKEVFGRVDQAMKTDEDDLLV